MDLKDQLKTLPSTPGVYIYKDAGGQVLYVGKAKLLKARVRSYFLKSAKLEPMKQEMVGLISSLQTISTDTEHEALILEATLIGKYQPPYNVVLRDDKYYLFIKITKEELPRVFLTRRIVKDHARYFGPYSSAKSVRATLRLLRRIFPFRDEKDSAHDVVFPHPLFSRSEKSAPRSSVVSERQSEMGPTSEQYRQNITNIISFLQGKREDIMAKLKTGMEQAVAREQFEQAALWRDQLKALEKLEGFQKVYLPSKESFDVISIASENSRSAGNVFQIRDGKLLNKLTFLLRHKVLTGTEETLRQFLAQYYAVAQDIPATILLPWPLADVKTMATSIRPNSPPVFLVPERGKKRQLITMGAMNAQQLLTQQTAIFLGQETLKKAHQELVQALGLDPKKIHRVETYDISNIQGTLATASMVVFQDGQANPKQYRKFRIKMDNTPNDFAMLQETLHRWFAHHLNQAEQKSWPAPDLIIIDGGKGQLSSAVKVLRELNIQVPIISLAKQEEEIFQPGKSLSLRLPYDSQAMYLIQRMRDEAHRFTITYHRLLRSKAQRRSILDEVPGIGPKNKKKLLARFGSLKAIRTASDDELAHIIGEEKTKVLREYI